MTFFKAGGYIVNLDHIIYSFYSLEKPVDAIAIEGQTIAAVPNIVVTFVGGTQLELRGQEADKVKSILSEHS